MFLDYAGIRVTDLDRSLALFTGPLGLRELRRGTMDHGGIWVLLEDNLSRQRLELNWYPKGSKYATPYVAGQELDHLGFRVADVSKAVAELESAGLKVAIREVEDGELVCAYLHDADGIEIELILTPAS